MSEFLLNIIDEATPVSELSKIMELVQKKLLLVSIKGRIVGCITDGDIRRTLLKEIPNVESVLEIANRDFCKMLPNEILKAIRLTKSGVHRYIPLIDEYGRLVDIVGGYYSVQKNDNYTVLIMAGGRGLRLMPLTEETPKPMLQIMGKPIIHHIVESYIDAGITDIYISVNYLKEKIMEYFEDGRTFGANIIYLEELEPGGTIGSLAMINKKIKNNLIVINGDVITSLPIRNLVEFHKIHDDDMIMCVAPYDYTIPFGVIDVNNGYLTSVTEKPILRKYINAGVYLFSNVILNSLDIQNKMDAPELINILIKKGIKPRVFPLHESWHDVGSHEQLAMLTGRSV
jgi:dTDP-glucose pyrophosphorylase